MTRAELAALPKGTKLFLISRKVSRSGMRQVFDVFYMELTQRGNCEDQVLTFPATNDASPRWIRLSNQTQMKPFSNERDEFNKRFGVHACGSVDEDRRVGGSYYVNGCGFSRSDELVESLSIWATDDPKHFTCEVL